MPDFRSRQERNRDQDSAHDARSQEQADYKRMYETVLAENRELHGKLSSMEASFGEALAEFETVKGQFAALEIKMKERSGELLQVGENMQTMVASGYEQQTDLMERFRADISQRLTAAKTQSPNLIKNDG